ncbi:MAG: hypothetical protein JW722_01025 [Demequinaceae bacterium]|nr:hypothetical protein [Demequinaceae bacterium]
MGRKTIVGMLAVVAVLTLATGCESSTEDELQSFPAGYIDSAYAVPDGSALYFLHGVGSTIDMLQSNQDARPVTAHLPGHQAADGGYWWNTDLYVSQSTGTGGWGEPQNLGSAINTEHMECCAWVSDDQTVLVFTRESVTEPSLSGSFLSRWDEETDTWGTPERLPGDLGDYEVTGFADFQLLPSGNLYFWSATLLGNGALYWAESTGPNEWAASTLLPDQFQTDLDETQPWVNDEETILCFNRRGEDANTQLLCATRGSADEEWGIPDVIPVEGMADANGLSVWGEPSFSSEGSLYMIRFDTSVEGWQAEILVSERQEDGSFGIPRPVEFDY